jgi:hypothetical protein
MPGRRYNWHIKSRQNLKMSRIFTKRQPHTTSSAADAELPESAYSSLLTPADRSSSSSPTSMQPRPYTVILTNQPRRSDSQRSWLGALESRRYSAGERPAPRKLVKDPSGSGRPSFSVEIADGDVSSGRGGGRLRRKLARLRMYLRRED